MYYTIKLFADEGHLSLFDGLYLTEKYKLGSPSDLFTNDRLKALSVDEFEVSTYLKAKYKDLETLAGGHEFRLALNAV